MSPPYTLKDFIAEIVKKVRTEKSPSHLSVTAPSFHPKVTTPCISVTSLVSPSLPSLVPVPSSQLPLSILHQYFPLATALHYISGQELVTLARSSRYTITEGRVALSDQAFCIPFMDTEVTYVVTEKGDNLGTLEEGDSVVDEIVSCVRNFKAGLRVRLTEVERMEELLRQVQEMRNMRDKNKDLVTPDSYKVLEADVPDLALDGQACPAGLVTGVESGDDRKQQGPELGRFVNKEVTKNYFEVLERYPVKKASEQYLEETFNKSLRNQDGHHNIVDDYGFSDTEDDISDVNNADLSWKAVSPINDKDVKYLKDLIVEKVSDHKVQQFEAPSQMKTVIQQPIFPEKSFTPVSLHSPDKSSPSTRPRCVRRISSAKPVISEM
eukprot:GFUD01026405.1.p1 GENE.GFUD01026405.1~~GFUD01026405.1.p1  ORF type:complete len:381 (-),score=129.50 GFUD01026405.1:12-1154(-)